MSYLNLLEESFPGIRDSIVRCEALGFPWGDGRLFLKEDKGEVVSHVSIFEGSLLVEGVWYRVGMLHAVCTKASHRGQGLATQLIQAALVWAESRCQMVLLFTASPSFYERLSFRYIQEYRFHLPCVHPQGSQLLRPVVATADNDLFLRCYREREPVSKRLWIKDSGSIASHNALFATYPTYWSLYYSPAIDGFISYQLEGKTLHLFDIVARKIPSLDLVLDHLPAEINEIYFYFSPERLTDKASAKPYLYDNGHLLVHGTWPYDQAFMISPLSRC